MIERIRAQPAFATALAAAQLDRLEALSSRSLGTAVTASRSSWVRRHQVDLFDFFAKTYSYPTLRDQWRGIARTTVLAASRVKRERAAYAWLHEHGFATPQVLAWGEHRRFGFLTRALLVTEAWPGQRVETWLNDFTPTQGKTLMASLCSFVQRLHAAGFRDRNLDLRNLLARRVGDDWEFCKIDSPRYRLVRPGHIQDRLAAADWRRLRSSCTAAGHELPPLQN